ncbi:MAG: hypothetical protein HY089_13060 [Ignavibacteriales bacterium]|nr:hypothetical protein [Ignavibacteriales bacterium]
MSKVTEDVDATSDIGDLRDRVTEFKYAFEQPQYPNMQTANMLSQIYQTTQTAVRPLSLLSSVHCEAPPEAWSGGTYEDTKQFTASFSQTVTYTVSNVWGCGSVRMGTTPGGSEIPILSSNGSASVTVPQGVIYVTARFAPYGQTTTGGAAINVNYDPGAPLTILLSDQQTEYDATMKYPTRTLVWNGTTWDATTTVVSRDIVGNVKESENINGVRSTTKWGWNSTLPVAQIQNARDAETSIVDFEDGTSGDWTNVGGSSISTAHTGTKGWSFTGTSQFISKTFPVSALPNTKYKFSGWLKTASTLPNLYWDILYNNGTTHAYIQSTAPQATNKWEYLETTADLSSYTNIVQVTLWSDPIKPDRQLGCSV